MNERKGCGLWEKKTKAGDKYWMGKYEGKVFFLWRNRSDNENAPTFRLNIEDDRPYERPQEEDSEDF